MKISILLPYKENYSKLNAGAVSLFVNDTTSKSKFKENINIFGSTLNKHFLSKNYINIPSKKTFFKSLNNQYVTDFLNNKNFQNTDILEVHNRPKYVKQIKQIYNKTIFLYFHNDPLSMSGSKYIFERKYLINNVDKLIFNSEWCKNQFFLGLKKNNILLEKTEICYQSTNKVNIDFNKKQKFISFVGKLNSAKGYDLFGNTIIKILEKYQNWSAYVIGDEPREKINFTHDRLFLLGFKTNKFILNFLKKVSISIVCSKWEEPFGRTSLEAASRGSAVIISNKGGLPETSKSAIILKNLTEENLFKEIDSLIKNKKKLLNIQKKNLDNFFLTHSYVASKLDKQRLKFEQKNINIHLEKVLKIIHITNFNYRFDGRLQYNTGRRINNGFIRLGHNVLTISDRDIINNNRKFNDINGKKTLKNRVINSYWNFKPDMIVLGHADNVSLETFDFLKTKKVKITQWFLDPVSKKGPDFYINKKRVLEKKNFLDSTFITTHPKALEFLIPNAYFIPNPSDPAFETLENYKKNCKYDLFFAMSHGVHRGNLKKGKSDNREIFLNQLIRKNNEIKFDIYGMNYNQPIWGQEFLNRISNSSMGLNLSRGAPIKYYSSDRIVQLIGNGLLTFIDKNTQLEDFLSKNEVVYYTNIDDLSDKLNKFKKDYKERIRIAKNGKKFYLKNLNSKIVANYIINKTFQISDKKKYIWE